MSALVIVRVNALPVIPVANTLYLVKRLDNLVELYMTSSDGQHTAHIATQEEVAAQAVIFSDSAPELPCDSKLWWNTVDGVLYIQYDDGTTVSWVEASPTAAVPEFGGTGTSNLVAHADHDHDAQYMKISLPVDW